jgi:hypothetical protein
MSTLQHDELLTQSEILEKETLPPEKEADQHAEAEPDEAHHGQDLSQNGDAMAAAMLLISRRAGVLANNRTRPCPGFSLEGPRGACYKSPMPRRDEQWLLFKYVGGEFTPVSKPFKSKAQAENTPSDSAERLELVSFDKPNSDLCLHKHMGARGAIEGEAER